MKRVILVTALLFAVPAWAQAPTPASPKEHTVVLSDDEINVTINMMNECVKARGLDCAEAAAVMTKKFRAAMQPPAVTITDKEPRPGPTPAPKPK